MEELRKQAKELKDTRKFKEAIQLYEKIWSKENQDKWLGWEYAYCLKNDGDITKAISVCKETHKLDSKFVMNNDLMAWSVYEQYFKIKKDVYTEQEMNQLEIVGQSIIRLIEQKQKSAYEYIVFAMINIYKKKGDKNSYTKIIEWLDRLDSEQLTNEIVSYTDKRGNDAELQSRKEEYYSLRSKSLAELERYQECIECCDNAEKNIEKYHYNNDIWLQARKYYSYGVLGEYEISVSGLKELANKKNHWSLLFKISQIYDRSNQSEEALRYAYKALLSNDPDKMKIKVIYFVAQKLQEMGDVELSNMHYIYYKKVREENEWSISPRIETYISMLSDTKKDFSFMKMKRIWLEKVKDGLEVHSGVISKIMKNGKNGFISCKRGSYFFKVNEAFGGRKVKENAEVTFLIEDSFDFSKGKKTEEARYVEVI